MIENVSVKQGIIITSEAAYCPRMDLPELLLRDFPELKAELNKTYSKVKRRSLYSLFKALWYQIVFLKQTYDIRWNICKAFKVKVTGQGSRSITEVYVSYAVFGACIWPWPMTLQTVIWP